MRAEDLDLRELLSFDPKGGLIHFGGQRALLFDAVALGLLRKELVETLGATLARGILTRFGFAHGWRTAESLRSAFPWDGEDEWRTAGGRLHALHGLVIVEPIEKEGGAFAEAIWHESFEAEQHVLHFGKSDEPVCWALCGFASGYLTFANGRDIYFLEERCRGRGDAVCHVVGRTAEEWGERIEPHLPFYRREGCEEVLRQVTDALKRTERALRARQRALARATGTDEGDPSGIVAKSEGMRQVLDLARRVAKVDSTVLLTGESGVGKERLARLIHDESARAAGPFVAVNCGAVAENLLESELFGHVRGSFTGATQDRPGLFEAAGRGTLFLDEVGEVPPAMQVKLLRVLEAREVRRVGENKSRPIDVRLVAATNRDLSKEVAAGRFREDLYYRLRVVELRIAPLRDRKEDVLPLAHALLAETSRRLGRRMTGFAPEAAGQLVRYGWPGNVRELRNAIERAVALARGSRVELLDLPDEVRGAQAVSLVPGEGRALEDVEREFILASLEANGGSQVKTAGQLKIGIATLRRKLKRYRERGQAVRDAARRAPRSK